MRVPHDFCVPAAKSARASDGSHGHEALQFAPLHCSDKTGNQTDNEF